MRANLFWLNDEQWAKIEPLIPMNRPGPKPQNNRRILSGIIHVLKTGCRWQDCPPEYGPHTTVYNRFNRWSGRGIWQQIFETVAGSPAPPEQVALDSTHVKAHRCAGGGKGGRRNRRSVSPRAGGTASFIRHDKEAYKGRNVIERCYCRLKDFRRIATRYDKLARNFFSSVCFVAALVHWM